MLHFNFLDSGGVFTTGFKCSGVGGELIGAAGSLLGGLFSSSGSRYAARKQLQAVRETNASNLQIAQQNNAFNERMWNLQNEYNSPSAQRTRFEQAGLNPYLMMDGSSAGNAQSSVTADPSGVQAAPDVGSTIAGGYQVLGSSISSAASQIAQMVYNNDLQSANVAKANAEASNVTAQSQYQELQNQFAVAQFLSDLRLKKIQGDISQKDYEFLRDSMHDRLDSVKFQNTLYGSQSSYYNQMAGLYDVQRQIDETNLKWLPREKQVSIMAAIQNARTAASQMRLNDASSRNMIAMAALNAANEAGVRLDNKLKDSVFDLSVGLVENQYQKGFFEKEQYAGGWNLGLPGRADWVFSRSARDKAGKPEFTWSEVRGNKFRKAKEVK
jgi:hypothetical protein